MADLTLHQLSCRTAGPDDLIVGPIDLHVAERDLLVLTGPDGCGAHEVVRAVAGLGGVVGGEVRVGSDPIHDMPPAKRPVAWVGSYPSLYPGLTVQGNIACGLRARKYAGPQVERQVQESAALAGVGPILAQRVGGLSPLQHQKAAIARAIARQPRVLIFDSPLRGLTEGDQSELRALIHRLQQRLRVPILYATGNCSEALQIAQRITILNSGKVVQTATPFDIYSQPLNRFVAGWMTRPRLNLLEGTLSTKDDQVTFKEAGGGSIRLRIGTTEQWAGHLSRPVLMGLRPEDCPLVADNAAGSASSFQALIEYAEPNGPEAAFHIQTGAHTLIVRSPVSSDPLVLGHRARFELFPERCLFFDKETGDRIPRPPETN